MNHAALPMNGGLARGWSRAGDFLALTKPRIAMLELVAVTAAAFVAARGPADPVVLLWTLLGTALVAASASAMNQCYERKADALMARTCDRPLPQGRVSANEARWFAGGTLGGGVALLGLGVNGATMLLAVATWAMYVLVYTPLKRRTHANTMVGAIAGAMPVLIGWTSVGRPLDFEAATLFVMLFLWQFPHFMAIAWIYRRQYRAAGFQMLTVVDRSGRRAGVQAVLAALVLVPVSLIPGVLLLEPTYFVAALLLGLWQLTVAAQFLARRDRRTARRLLHATLFYLPAIMMLLMLTPLI